MPIYLRASRLVLLGLACAALYLYWRVGLTSNDAGGEYWEQFGTNETLAWRVARRLLVVSLHRRVDRRRRLTPLFEAHQLVEEASSAGKLADVAGPYFQYVNATDSTDPVIQRVLAHVRAQRKHEFECWKNGTTLRNEAGKRASFSDGSSKNVEDVWGSDLWVSGDEPSSFQSQEPWDDMLDPDEDYPIPCERGNPFNPKKFANIGLAGDVSPVASTSQLSVYNDSATNQRPTINWLTPATVACWYSHLQIIRLIAAFRESDYRIIPNGTNSYEPAYIILEDDVDFEWSIPLLLSQLVPSLPKGWEILFLGHCWSDEARYPPLYSTFFPPSDSLTTVNPRTQKRVAVHPANAPLCTHAYALSPQGARRLYNLLRHPAFAFSRPLDQAISWLIRSGHLKQAYSIVPSLVVQTKEGKSDISERRGSRWRDKLVDSTKERVRKRERGASWRGWFGF